MPFFSTRDIHNISPHIAPKMDPSTAIDKPHKFVLFFLIPDSESAYQVVNDPNNRHLVSFSRDGKKGLGIGHIQSTSRDPDVLATLGRDGDVTVSGINMIAREHCQFVLNRGTGAILFHDMSKAESSQVFGENSTPFGADNPRHVVVGQDLNTKIGMGGADSNLIMFSLVWHYARAQLKAKLEERQHTTLDLNPRLAPTVLCEPGANSSFRGKLGYIPGEGQR